MRGVPANHSAIFRIKHCVEGLEDCFIHFLLNMSAYNANYERGVGMPADYHADPQVMFTGGGHACANPLAIKIDFVGRLDNFEEDWQSIMKAANGVDSPACQLVHSAHKSAIPMQTSSEELKKLFLKKSDPSALKGALHNFLLGVKVNEEVLNIIKDVYKEDYACFGF